MDSTIRVSRSAILRAWAEATLVARVHLSELSALRGSVVMPRCTRRDHGSRCGCARGTVRLFKTNHAATSFSRKFEGIRRVLGAVSWREDGDIEVLS